MLAALLVSRAWSQEPRTISPLTALAWAGLAAALFALLSMPGNELHGFLFGAEEEADVDLLADLLGDGLAALQAALLVITPIALLVGVPWRDTRRARAVAPIPTASAPDAATDGTDA